MREFTVKILDLSLIPCLVTSEARGDNRVASLAPIRLSAPVVASLIMTSLLALLLALL